MSPQGISRNAPCPCGSGKKYKLCCWTRESELSPLQLRRRLGEISRKLNKAYINFIEEHPERYNLKEAAGEFELLNDEPDSEMNSVHFPLFFPWLYYTWQPADWKKDSDQPGNMLKTNLPRIAEAYLEQHSDQLLPIERKYIELNLLEGYSFYEVMECYPGSRMQLRDILLEREIEVLEKMGSANLQKNDIIYAKIIQYNTVGSIESNGSVVIPPGQKMAIIDLRAVMQQAKYGELTPDDLLKWDVATREIYFDIFVQLHNAHKNIVQNMRNMDGDPLAFHELFYKISSPQIAFNQLRTLSGDSEEELLENAEYDHAGNLTKLTVKWMGTAKHSSQAENEVTLGELEINGTELKISVNSENRAQQIRRIVEERMQNQAGFIKMNVKTMAEVYREMPATHHSTSSEPDEPEDPEQAELLRMAAEKFFDDHYRRWLDMELPALNGMTPRQAIKSKDGREKVTALLADMERNELRLSKNEPHQLKHIQWVRQQLGLA